LLIWTNDRLMSAWPSCTIEPGAEIRGIMCYLEPERIVEWISRFVGWMGNERKAGLVEVQAGDIGFHLHDISFGSYVISVCFPEGTCIRGVFNNAFLFRRPWSEEVKE